MERCVSNAKEKEYAGVLVVQSLKNIGPYNRLLLRSQDVPFLEHHPLLFLLVAMATLGSQQAQ
jgi:hypothetical protein